MKLADPIWRLNNLYYIKDTQGKRIKFQLNWAQRELLDSLHPFEIVLKCRQIGITTFFTIYALDQILWNENKQAGIIAQTLDDASNIFKDKLKFAFDNLHPALRPLFKTIGDSAKELAFSHGSVIRVGTSLRSSTLQFLHISEFGKICAKDPEKAREIITGSLNTIHPGQRIFIESTAEGKEGRFYEMCQIAQAQDPLTLSNLDFKFRFFPWHKHPDYRLDNKVIIPTQLEEYFAKLQLMAIPLNDNQKWWYAKKYETQQEDMTREFPSYPEEAFSSSQEGYWYAVQLKELYDKGHVLNISYDKALLVHTAWDLGQADYMVIWFFQINRAGEIMVIDYFQSRDTDLNLVKSLLKSKNYTYGTHIWPHDANARDRAGITFVKQAGEIDLYGLVLEVADKQHGIRLVRTTLSKCWFDKDRCKLGLIALQNYKKKWSSSIGGWTSEDAHDDASHGADAFRYLCSGYNRVENANDIKSDAKALNSFFGY